MLSLLLGICVLRKQQRTVFFSLGNICVEAFILKNVLFCKAFMIVVNILCDAFFVFCEDLLKFPSHPDTFVATLLPFRMK